MSNRRPAVLLVDPLWAGTGCKKAVRDMGMDIVSLFTLEPDELRTAWPDHAEDDDVSLYATGAAEALSALAGVDHEIRAVVPASETAGHVAGVVARELGLPHDDVGPARARHDKFLMREHAAAAGLRIPAYRLVRHPSEVRGAADDIGYPAIVKQRVGAGSIGATLLPDAASAADFRVVDRNNIFGRTVDAWLVEEYVRGREFAVNAFSSGGDHRVIDMWEYRRPDDRDYDFPLWDNVQATPEDPDWARVEEYVLRVLTAFGVRHGPSHTEVKANADGVHLMEVAARLPGGPATDQWEKFTDFRPFHDTVRAYLGQRPDVMDRPVGGRAVFGAVALHNETGPGTLVAVHGLDELRNHPGVDKVLVSYRPGDHVPSTRDVRSIPVGAWISGPDQEAVVRVIKEVRAMVRLEIRPDR
ncbi:ATP-grasp domain-containing protein [Streptomyces sp. MRC013]|uniref:ATP-grasp domain-containing protein n=1 Tax=Streptomyces sp. MRC013 TaxID=2898276 RepID=UPI0020266181|nr:ATP-grasp domain-containing protein [Streptomyces sp. MRC013]URM88718.1 ATP-grasp domain-containing protein [Streptomyces sp. MRC013]